MKPVDVSVVCAITAHATRVSENHREFAQALAVAGRSAEFIYVLDGPRDPALAELARSDDDRFPIRVFRMARGFGEATALQVGFAHARGAHVLTVPDRPQIDPAVIGEVLTRLDRGDEVVVTRRHPRKDAWLNRVQNRVFHSLVAWAVKHPFHDLTCCVRGFTRDAALKLDLYGDLHRFIPVIANRNGYRVVELSAPQHPANLALRLKNPGEYAKRLVDIINIFFLARFTRKPLRFFGLVGSSIGAVGFVITAWLAIERIAGLSALADRPLLLLGVLLIVLGVQITAIGLLGEIIIFFSTKRDMPEVREVASRRLPGEPTAESVSARSGADGA